LELFLGLGFPLLPSSGNFSANAFTV